MHVCRGSHNVYAQPSPCLEAVQHGCTAGQHNVIVELTLYVNVALVDGVVHEVVDAWSFLAQGCGVEKNLGGPAHTHNWDTTHISTGISRPRPVTLVSVSCSACLLAAEARVPYASVCQPEQHLLEALSANSDGVAVWQDELLVNG